MPIGPAVRRDCFRKGAIGESGPLSLLAIDVGNDGEARAAPLIRAYVDAVSEQIRRVFHDEEPEAETIRPTLIGPLKGTEYRRQGLGGDADAGVAHLDAQLRAKTPSGDGHSATGRRVINRVSYE